MSDGGQANPENKGFPPLIDGEELLGHQPCAALVGKKFEEGTLRVSSYAVAFASNGSIGKSGANFVIGWAVPVGAISELKSVPGEAARLRLECTDFRSIDLRFESADAARAFRRDINTIAVADCSNETSFVFAHRRASTDEELNAWLPHDWLRQEYERLGLVSPNWRISTANADHALIPSYPAALVTRRLQSLWVSGEMGGFLRCAGGTRLTVR
ncbi:hypothetical protein T484DRAFT_1764720 [Baffinella frigidus]|nr:hypothetical protein T484DRAFT_1764720 [Cryptophyta sp. CCMP2293]